MKKNVMVMLLVFVSLQGYAASPSQLQEGFYGNTELAPYPGNNHSGGDSSYNNEYWYVAQPRYCGFKLSWTDAAKKSFLLETGMNPFNGSICEHKITLYSCQEQTCTSADYKDTIIPIEGGFKKTSTVGLVTWIFSSTKDPQTYLFQTQRKLLLKDSKVSSVDELCESAKEVTTKESIQNCIKAGYSQCDIFYSALQGRLNISNAFCVYEVVTKGSL